MLSSSISSFIGIHTSLLSLDQDSGELKLSKSDMKYEVQRQSKKSHSPSSQTFKKHYIGAVDYHTYRLSNCSPRYDENVFSYVAKLVKKKKSRMKTHFHGPNSQISIIDFLEIFKLAYDTNNKHERAATWVLPH